MTAMKRQRISAIDNAWLRMDRPSNLMMICGVLLFDGHRFCQLLEAPADAVAQVRQSIASDPRHEFMTVLVDRPHPGPTTLEGWQAGYCGPFELDLLVGPERCDADQAMAMFRAILTRADLSP